MIAAIGMAWAGTAPGGPPEGVNPEDLTHWEAGRAALLAGPPGCWELSGRVELTAVTYTPTSGWTRGGKEDHAFVGSFSGHLADGRWTALDYDLSPKDKPGEPAKLSLPIYPLVGRIDPEVPHRTNPPPSDDSGLTVETGNEDALNLIDRVLDELHPDATTSYGEWREDEHAVELIEDVPISAKAHSQLVTLTTKFPNGGAPTSLDAVFPPRIDQGDGLVKVRILNAQAHVRGHSVSDGAGEVVLPALDSLSFGGGALGFTVGYEQKLTYEHASRCVGPERPPG